MVIISYIKRLFLLEDVVPRKSTNEHGYYIAITSLDKIGKGSCPKHNIFFKSKSIESVFISATSSISSSAIFFFGHPQSIQTRPTKTDALDKILKHDIFLKSEPCKSRLLLEKQMGDHRYVVSQNPCS